MHDLEIVKNRIVTGGFPELSGIEIYPEYKKIKDGYLEFYRIKKGTYQINVDRSLGNATLGVVEGGTAHELAHIARDNKRWRIFHTFDMFLYNNWRWYETRDERRTDILVVERGYGQQLLEFVRYANERREDFTAKDGLTAEELERMLAGGI